MKKVLIALAVGLLVALLIVLVSMFISTTYGDLMPDGDRQEQAETYTDPDYGDREEHDGQTAQAGGEKNTAAKTKKGGLFSFLKKDSKKDSGTAAEQSSPDSEAAAAPGSTGEASPGSSATPAPGTTPGPTSKATASPGASAAPGTTPDTGRLTPAQVAGVLNQAFALQGLSANATAVAYDTGVTVLEQTSIAYADYQAALENDPNGEAATTVSAFLANEAAYWSSTFDTIVAQTGYTGGLSLVFVFTDGVEYPGI